MKWKWRKTESQRDLLTFMVFMGPVRDEAEESESEQRIKGKGTEPFGQNRLCVPCPCCSACPVQRRLGCARS